MNEQRINFFGLIGAEITADAFRAQLDLLDRSAPLLVEINSEGGSVQEAAAIYNILRTWPGGVVVEVVGWALSAATFVAMAGKTIRMHESSLLMVHAPWLNTSGNAESLRGSADLLDQVAETMRIAYMRTGQPESVVRGWLDGQDHWFTADQSMKFGLVDEVINAAAMAAAAVNVQACRHHIPEAIKTRIQAMNTNAPHSVDEIKAAAVRAERERVQGIQRALQPFMERAGIRALFDQAIVSASMTEEEVGRRALSIMAAGSSPIGGTYFAEQGPENGSRGASTLVAAACDTLLMRAGIQVNEPHPATSDTNRMNIVAIAERILSMQGKSVASMSKTDVINAALSTSDFKQLLSNTVGKALLAGYESAPATHAAWTAEREVPDFKKQTLVSLSEAPDLYQVLEGGEYQFGSLADSSSEFQLVTHGRIVNLTRQALINDDLSAFASLPLAFGAASRRLEADKVYAMLSSTANLADGKPLFHADRGNLASVQGPLNIPMLGAARAAMRKQKGMNGQGYIDPQPRYLIVPVALETEAESLIATLTTVVNGTDAPRSVDWIKNLILVADPRLDAVSDTAWYLSADPMQVQGITRAYLQGEQRPHVEEKDEFNRDVISWKIRLDFAAGVVDPRCLFKNLGA
jgi:ATP-dependent protease ClpP protease subunit